MIRNYNTEPDLFKRCIKLIDECFPGSKVFAFTETGIKYNASWKEASTPFIVEEKGEVIAHAGVWPISLMLNGKEHKSASIHGVCVKPEFRGKGYFKQLMQEAIHYADTHFDSSFLFTSKPYLYKNSPFNLMLPEYYFVLSDKLQLKSSPSDIRVLNLENKEDLNLVHHLLSTRMPLSDQLSIIGKYGSILFILSMLDHKIYYSDRLNTIVAYEIINNTLHLKEIISQKQQNIADIIALIPEPFNKIVLQFCPDRFVDEKDYTAELAGPECCIMVSKNFTFDSKYFRYPELYWC